jgi:opacity protein-like surface antigen
MKTNKNFFLTILMVVLFSGSCFSQEKELKTNWEISISSGQSFIDYYNQGFGTGYSTGLTIKPEITCNISKHFSGSFSLLVTSAHNGDKNANYLRVFATQNGSVSVFNHYQTTLSPEIQFSPIKTGRHKLYIGIGPTYSFGNSLLSQSYNEASTTMAKNINEFGYQGTLGYKLCFAKKWTIGGNYIYNKGVIKTEHLLISFGYKIN